MFKQALLKNGTDAMKESRIPDFLASVKDIILVLALNNEILYYSFVMTLILILIFLVS